MLTDYGGETYVCPSVDVGFPPLPWGFVTCCDLFTMTIMLIIGFSEAHATPQGQPMKMK